MESLMDLLGFGATAATGGIFGLAGSVVGFFGKWMTRRQEMQAKREERAHELRLLEEQRLGKREESEHEIAIESSRGAWSGLTESLKSDAVASGNTHTWVNDVRSLFRPFLTVLLIAVVGWMFHSLLKALLGANDKLLMVFTEVEIKTLLAYIVYSTVFSASTSVVWWWGDRALTPPGWKHR